MSEYMFEKHMDRNIELKLREMERAVEKETITSIIAPSSQEKRAKINDFVNHFEH